MAVVSWKFPAEQFAQEAAEAAEYVPTLQFMQLEEPGKP